MITEQQLQEIADVLKGTSMLVFEALEKLWIETDGTEDEVEDRLLDLSVERCKACDWWHESCELDNEIGGEAGYCDDCSADLTTEI